MKYYLQGKLIVSDHRGINSSSICFSGPQPINRFCILTYSGFPRRGINLLRCLLTNTKFINPLRATHTEVLVSNAGTKPKKAFECG